MNAPAFTDGLGPSWLRNTSLALCYVAFPLSNQVVAALGMPLYRNWIDFAWVALVISLLALRPFGRVTKRFPMGRMLTAAICVTAFAWALTGAVTGQVPPVTAAMELKPVFYVLVAVVVLRSVAAPAPEAFCFYGAVLSVLLVVEALARSTTGGSVERPLGSGEVNYDAALLCVSLAFAATNRHLARRYGWIIWIGIIASFSRTSLLAACLVLLFSSAVDLRVRLLMSSLAVFGRNAASALGRIGHCVGRGDQLCAAGVNSRFPEE